MRWIRYEHEGAPRYGIVHGEGDGIHNENLEVELIAPIAMEKGVRFAIREGGRTVGAGTVTDIIE